MSTRPDNRPPRPAAQADSGQETASGAALAAPDVLGLSDTLSDAIRVMRLPLLMGPLLVHACLAPQSLPTQYILSHVVGDVSVPAFFFVSGLLYFANYDGTLRGYTRKLRNRVRSLAIPYLLWNLIGYFALAYVVHMVAKSDFLKSFWAVRVARRLSASAPVDGPLYFIKGLFFLALAAPFFHFALRRRTLVWVVPVTVLFWLIAPVPSLADRMFVVATPMFLLGGLFALRGQNILSRLVTSGRASLISIVFFVTVSAVNVGLHWAGIDCKAVQRLNILMGIPAWFAVSGALSRGALAPFLRWAQGFAMFLFCSFDLIMTVFREIWPPLHHTGDIYCMSVALMTFAASLAAYLILEIVARPLLRLLVGSRR